MEKEPQNPEESISESNETGEGDGSRYNEDEAFLAYHLARKEEGIASGEEPRKESQEFANDIIEELRSEGLSLDGLDWQRMGSAKDPVEIVALLKEYAQSRGVDSEKISEYLEDTKNDLKDFSYLKEYLKRFAVTISLLGVLGAGEGLADPLNKSDVHEFPKEKMETMKDSEIFKANEIAKEELAEYQKDNREYFEKLKHNHPDIKEIRISRILVSQKIVEEGRERQQIVPAVVADVELVVTTKDGREVTLNDKSYKNINEGYVLNDGLVHDSVDYLVKKGWIPASNAAHSGAWEKDMRSRFQDKLIYESVHRIGDQMLSRRF